MKLINDDCIKAMKEMKLNVYKHLDLVIPAQLFKPLRRSWGEA